MDKALISFCNLLERNFPLGGPRGHLEKKLGKRLLNILEKEKVLLYRRISKSFPCESNAGNNCPRRICPMGNGTYLAVCGNTPKECEDVILMQSDVETLAVNPERLFQMIAKALQIRPRYEELVDFKNVYRVGTFIPNPGFLHPFYFVVRASPNGYSEALNALRAYQMGGHFAVLVLTDRFINDGTRQRMASLGIPIFSLCDAIGLNDNGFLSKVNPIRFFSSIGRGAQVPLANPPAITFKAITGDGTNQPLWHQLDDQGYNDLCREENRYRIYADERSRIAFKTVNGKREKSEDVRSSYFQMLCACAERRSHFDPAVDPEFDGRFRDPKQTFDKARQKIDIKIQVANGKPEYALFKTRRIDRHAVYEFDPSPEISFALIFELRP